MNPCQRIETQRRYQHRDDSRRGHPLQHRDQQHHGQQQRGEQRHGQRQRNRQRSDQRDEGWADRGTWANLHDDSGGTQSALDDPHSSDDSVGSRGRHTVDDSPVQQLSPGEHHHQSTQRSDAGSDFGSDSKGNDNRRNRSNRAPGGGRGTTQHKQLGNPRTGSQRGEHSNQGISGRPGEQYGDLHGPRPSGPRAAGYHDDDHYGGRRGRSERDQQYGSRRGHGSRRREDPRVRDEQ